MVLSPSNEPAQRVDYEDQSGGDENTEIVWKHVSEPFRRMTWIQVWIVDHVDHRRKIYTIAHAGKHRYH